MEKWPDPAARDKKLSKTIPTTTYPAAKSGRIFIFGTRKTHTMPSSRKSESSTITTTDTSWVPEMSRDNALKGTAAVVLTAGVAYGVYRLHRWYNKLSWKDLLPYNDEEKEE